MIGNDDGKTKSPEINIDHDFATPEKQEARTFLRERFLRVITGVIGEHATFYMHENTKVEAEFRGCDVDCSDIFARNLATPLGKVPEAVLRGTDIICIEINGIKAKP